MNRQRGAELATTRKAVGENLTGPETNTGIFLIRVTPHQNLVFLASYSNGVSYNSFENGEKQRPFQSTQRPKDALTLRVHKLSAGVLCALASLRDSLSCGDAALRESW